jgi:hypothetical protein
MPLVLPDSSQLNIGINKNSVAVGTEPALNFIEGSNITLTVLDNAAANRVDVTPSVLVSDYAGQVNGSHPASYWHLDEPSGTAASDVNAVVNGTYVAAPTLAQPSLASGSSVLFNTTGQGVDFGNVAYPFTGVQPFSLECWVSVTSLDTGNARQGVWSRAFTDANGEQGYRVVVWGDYPASTYRIEFYRTVNSTQIIAGTSAGTHSLGSENHVVATYDGTVPRLYVNGALAATGATDTRSIVAGSAKLVFANTSGLAANVLRGLGDEPAVYTRALPVSEISAHYSAGV